MSAKPKPPIVITLTLPDAFGSATLLIQRGELAHMRQFIYSDETDLNAIIRDAAESLAVVEADPPIIPDAPPPAPASTRTKPTTPPPPPAEPTVDIPLKKGKKAVKISHLKITGGETDAAAYRQAVQLAAIFIDGKLWDGETPIRIDDVWALAKKMKHLTARDMPLFSLTDFVQVGESETEIVPDETADDDEPVTLMPPLELVHSANGHHTSDQTALL